GDTSPLEHFFNLIGRGGSPKRPRAIEGNRPYLPWIVAHLNELNGGDFYFLQRFSLKFYVAHCSGSQKYFCQTPLAFDPLRSSGFNICLGTDSLASNRTLSLFDEMRAFQKKFPRVPPEEILKMATVNPAQALRQENALGKIRRAALADLIAVPFNGGDLFEE